MDNESTIGLQRRKTGAGFGLLLPLALLFVLPVSATQATASHGVISASSPSEPEESDYSTVDFIHKELSERVAASAAWMDAYFDDENFDDEDNRTTLRLSLSSFTEESEDTDFGAQVRLRLSLPNWNDRLQLIISGDSEDSDTAESLDGDPDDLTKDNEKNVTLGLRYYVRQTPRHNVSLGGGIRSSDGSVNIYIQPRYRYFKDLGTWGFRFIQKVGWFEPEGFDSRSTLQFERTFDDEYFFRTSGKVNWYEDEEGLYVQSLTTEKKYALFLEEIGDVKAAKAEVQKLNAENQALQAKVSDLEARLAKLEALLSKGN